MALYSHLAAENVCHPHRRRIHGKGETRECGSEAIVEIQRRMRNGSSLFAGQFPREQSRKYLQRLLVYTLALTLLFECSRKGSTSTTIGHPARLSLFISSVRLAHKIEVQSSAERQEEQADRCVEK